MPNDRITYAYFSYGLFDVTAKADATFTTSSNSSFANINLLKQTENVSSFNYLTLEHNFSTLDGTLSEQPNTSSDIAFVSSEIADSSGNFTSGSEPTINIAFTTPHSSAGLTFYFDEDYPTQATITWKDEDAQVLHSETYDIDSLMWILEESVENYQSIIIEFTEAHPYRRVKLRRLDFGMGLLWQDNEIKEAELVLENDKMSDMLSVNTLTFTLIDDEDAYNLANKDGLHSYLQRHQILSAYEIYNGAQLYLGDYFLSEYSVDSNLLKLSCTSYMGLLDEVNFNDGAIYNGTLAGTILEDIFDLCNLDNYSIDTVTYNTPVYGTIKPMTCREALREILFACGSVVSTTTNEGVAVHKNSPIIEDTITRNKKISTKVTKLEYVHGIDVAYSTYTLDDDVYELANDTFAAGTNTVEFSTPCTNYSLSAGTITSSSCYYVTFTLDTAGTVVITGKSYTESNYKVSARNNSLQSGELETIEEYTTTLCNQAMAQSLAETLLEYNQYRVQLDIKQLATDIETDNRYFVSNTTTTYDDYIAWYTKRTLDLTGGFIDTATMRGYYKDDYVYQYASDGTIRDELRAGETLGLI